MAIQTHKTGKWSWKFTPGAEEFLQYLLKRWETIEDLPGAEVLKSNLSRTVIAFPSTSSRPALIIKRYHVRGLKERLKYVLLLSRAASEWTALKHLRTTEVFVPRPLAFGEKRSGRILFSAGLIMERLPNARGVSQWLREKRVGDPVRLEVFRQVGYQVAKLHGAGCRHSDLHAGNILIREGGLEDKPQVVLIDHHVCRIGAMPSERQKRNNLAKLLHSFLPIIKHSEALELLRAYKEACGAPKWKVSTLQRVLDDLVHRAHHLEAVRLRSRLKRCWKNSSQFARTISKGWRVYRRREIPLDSLQVFQEGQINFEAISEAPLGVLVGETTLELKKGGQPVVVKQRSCNGFWRRIWYRFFPGPLHKEWGEARSREVRGIPNPKALALMEQYRYGLPAREILITERIVEDEP